MPESIQKMTDAAGKPFNSPQSDDGTSRRRVLAGTAAAGVGAVGLSGSAGAVAQENNGNNGSSGNGGSNCPGADDTSAVEVLNFALTLEHLENNFYQQGEEDFSDEELRTAEVLCARNEELNAQVPARLEAIGEHEAAHVEVITQTIEKLGGDPVEEGCYDFGYSNASEFLQVAAALETTGVSAYDGAIKFLERGKLLTAAATVATVEARHSSFLNEITGENPFPRAFDNAKSMEEIKEIASQFIVQCENGGGGGNSSNAN